MSTVTRTICDMCGKGQEAGISVPENRHELYVSNKSSGWSLTIELICTSNRHVCEACKEKMVDDFILKRSK